MTTLNLIAMLHCVATATIFAAMSVPLVLGKVKRNGWYGFRLPKAFASEDNWTRINRYGGRLFILWSIPIAATGLAALVLPLGTLDEPNSLLVFLVLLAPALILIPVVQTCLYAHRL